MYYYLTHVGENGVRCLKSKLMLQKYCISCLVLIASALTSEALWSERLNAAPLVGNGEFEFYFIAPEKKVEAEGHISRIAELEAERVRIKADLKRAQEEFAAAESRAPRKKTTRLEWSPVEGSASYTVKIFNAEKKLLETKQVEESSITVELDPGEYFFQVAAATKFKTGSYSRISAFRATKPKPSEEHIAAEENLAVLKEKLVIAEKLRADHQSVLRADAISTAKAATPIVDLQAPEGASHFVALDLKGDSLRYSLVHLLPGRTGAMDRAAGVNGGATPSESHFWWGAGFVAGVQDSRLDFFRVSLGAEAFVRYDKPFYRYFYPQLKVTLAYSPSKSNVYDAMLFANLYPGVYYPIKIGKGFSVLVSISTGPNIFLVLSSAASGSVLQWGVMPGTELHYALSDRTSLYAGAGINFTFDPQGVLKFVPISFGITSHF